MFAFKEEFPVSDVASLTTVDISVSFYQPIIGRNRQVIGFEVLARRWELHHQRYQGIDLPFLIRVPACGYRHAQSHSE